MDLPILCPVCRGALTYASPSFRCERGHTFDRSRRGYTNLLTGKAAGQHGDNAEMILARRAFLDGGSYAPLRDALCGAVRRHFPDGGVLLDAGCGECYYTDGVMTDLSDRHPTGVGIDISREALRYAGVRPSVKNGTLSLFVAGVYDMPLPDGSVDAVLNCFAPLATEEYLRVLKPGGTLHLAIPAEDHLWELKEVLYDTPYQNQVADFSLPGFDPPTVEPIRTVFTLHGQKEIGHLFAMTPYYYRTPKGGRARLASLDRLSVRAAFYLLSYRKAREISPLTDGENCSTINVS